MAKISEEEEKDWRNKNLKIEERTNEDWRSKALVPKRIDDMEDEE